MHLTLHRPVGGVQRSMDPQPLSAGRSVVRGRRARGAGRVLAALAAAILVAACGEDRPPAPPRPPPESASVEITQLLVGYRVEGRTPFTRSRSEALAVAETALARARAGERWERIVLELTDDRDDRGEPFNRGSYTIPRRGGAALRALQDAVLDTPVGELHRRPVDTGLGFVVFRRDR